MGRRGPVKKSAEKQKLAGNPGKRALQQPSAGSGGVGTAECPEWLPKIARTEWERALPLLKEPLRPADVAAFVCYCQSFADFRAAVIQLEKEGRTYVGPNGAICCHPAVRLAREASTRIKQFASEFGLTPAARSRVPDPPAPKEEDPLETFLTAK